MRATESGLIDYWKKQSGLNSDKCRHENQKALVDGNHPLKLIDLTSVLVAFFFGLGLSTIVFVMECVFHSLKAAKNKMANKQPEALELEK